MVILDVCPRLIAKRTVNGTETERKRIGNASELIGQQLKAIKIYCNDLLRSTIKNY